MPGKRVELVRGVRVVREPASLPHGRRLARAYHLDGTEAVISADDALRGEDVLSGFVCSLGAILSFDWKRNRRLRPA
jgi:hypothetical protein